MKVFYLLFLVSFITSCNQEEIIVVTNFEEDRLIFDGFLTNEIETQYFKVSVANNLGDSTTYAVSDILFSINSASEYIPFNLVNGNTMQSQFPFKAWPDTTYTIDYCYKGVCGEKDFMMPRLISIEDALPVDLENFIQTNFPIDLSISFGSSLNQWCRLDVYELDSVHLGDSLWSLQPHPVYDVFEVNNSSSEYYIQSDLLPATGFNQGPTFLKLKCYSLSQETGEYLNRLNTFMTGEFTGSQYQNPPYYFDDGTLGLIYGTVLDSVYISY
ncbi:MAG: hypothetical protein ACI857_001361 [Arenicella sp.]|jgi:hypothetical protein